MRAVESPIICPLMGSFWRKHIKFYLKKYKRVISHDMTVMSDAKFEVKLAFGSKNDLTTLLNFNMSSVKSEIWTLMYYIC